MTTLSYAGEQIDRSVLTMNGAFMTKATGCVILIGCVPTPAGHPKMYFAREVASVWLVT